MIKRKVFFELGIDVCGKIEQMARANGMTKKAVVEYCILGAPVKFGMLPGRGQELPVDRLSDVERKELYDEMFDLWRYDLSGRVDLADSEKVDLMREAYAADLRLNRLGVVGRHGALAEVRKLWESEIVSFERCLRQEAEEVHS